MFYIKLMLPSLLYLALSGGSAYAQSVQMAGITPGFDCSTGDSDVAWCLAVTPNGRVFTGNPHAPNATKATDGLQDRGKVLWGKGDKQPIRSIVIRCGKDFCGGIDSLGNVYGGRIKATSDIEFFAKR